MSTDTAPNLPVLPLHQALEADIPCLVPIGWIGNEPIHFIHDPERLDRLQKEIDYWEGL